MKKMSLLVAGAACLVATSCGTLGAGSATTGTGTDVLNGVIGVLNNANTIGDVISSVIGSNKLTQAQLYGTWKYNGPGCAFTTNSALAKAGGEVVASQIKSKLKEDYSKVGFSSKNTQITFNKDNTFTAYVDGKKFSGNQPGRGHPLRVKKTLDTYPDHVRDERQRCAELYRRDQQELQRRQTGI